MERKINVLGVSYDEELDLQIEYQKYQVEADLDLFAGDLPHGDHV